MARITCCEQQTTRSHRKNICSKEGLLEKGHNVGRDRGAIGGNALGHRIKANIGQIGHRFADLEPLMLG